MRSFGKLIFGARGGRDNIVVHFFFFSFISFSAVSRQRLNVGVDVGAKGLQVCERDDDSASFKYELLWKKNNVKNVL